MRLCALAQDIMSAVAPTTKNGCMLHILRAIDETSAVAPRQNCTSCLIHTHIVTYFLVMHGTVPRIQSCHAWRARRSAARRAFGAGDLCTRHTRTTYITFTIGRTVAKSNP